MRNSIKPLVAGVLLAVASASPAFAADGDGSLHAQQQYDNARSTGDQSGWGIQEGTDVRASQGYGRNAGWNDMRARAHQWRENMSNSFHHLAGNRATDDDVTTRSGTTYNGTTSGTTYSGRTAGTTYNGATTGTAMSGDRPDPQAAPAAHSGQAVAPGPAAADAGRDVTGQPLQTNRDRGGPQGSGSKGTVDPTGVGAATMGGSPYGGNQDPNRPDAGSSSSQGR